MDRPIYSHNRIQSIPSLCRALALSELRLRSVARRAPRLYSDPQPIPKKNGGVRSVFDTKSPLKPLLKKINEVFFRHVRFPQYLTGSLVGRDYIANVDIHQKAQWAITEDVSHFFDHITEEHVYGIWQKFFGFSHEVATILTQLTTKDGKVFQGTPTSSYLANLVFWERESSLVKKLAARAIRYSRYVDDITLSSARDAGEDDKRWAISQVYATLGAGGFKPQRAKHGTFTGRAPIRIMGLNANRQPTLPKQERANIRAQVYQLEQRLAHGERGPEFHSALNQAYGKVGWLKRLHEREGRTLCNRLDAIRRALEGCSKK